MNLILASASPRRKEILQSLKLEFKVVVSVSDEITEKIKPEDIVKDLALQKATNVQNLIGKNAVIIAADTIVFIDGKILEKPKDKNEAYQMLSKLQGNWHTVYTGVCILKENKGTVNYFEKSCVHMRKVSEEEIWEYIKVAQPFDKAGAYGVQDESCNFVDKVEGELETVIGLPVIRLKKELNIN